MSINLTNLTNHIYENERENSFFNIHESILFFREIPFLKHFRYFCEFLISENLRTGFFIFNLLE